MIYNPWLAWVITLVLCILWMRFINVLADKNLIPSNVSRKIIHIGTGPLFVLCWLLFPEHHLSKWLAASVPFLIVVQVLLVGTGLIKDRTSVKSMARNGLGSELLKGPLFYGMIFVLLTILFWKTIHAVFALMILCGGDGTADLIGSRIRSPKLPWSKNKTIAGSFSMFIGSILITIIVTMILRLGFLNFSIQALLFPLLLISFIATVIESITPSDYDNLTVPISSLIMSLFFF